ncbi:MAG: hypothetical protein K8S54_08045 [Spirochaetia bacterium]|nr:hypothetical protein [Spirochaetia bacterium]
MGSVFRIAGYLKAKMDVRACAHTIFGTSMPIRAVFLLFTLLLTCATDNTVDSYDGQRRINAAMAAKYKQCNQPVSMLILVPFDEQEPDIKNCENEILSAACPFTRMPASCFLLLIKKSPKGDVDP